MLDVEDSFVEEDTDMGVVQRVDDVTATPFTDHEPEVSKQP